MGLLASLSTFSVTNTFPAVLLNTKTNRYQPSVVITGDPAHEPGEPLPKLMTKPMPPLHRLGARRDDVVDAVSAGAVVEFDVVVHAPSRQAVPGDRYRSLVTVNPLLGKAL